MDNLMPFYVIKQMQVANSMFHAITNHPKDANVMPQHLLNGCLFKDVGVEFEIAAEVVLVRIDIDGKIIASMKPFKLHWLHDQFVKLQSRHCHILQCKQDLEYGAAIKITLWLQYFDKLIK